MCNTNSKTCRSLASGFSYFLLYFWFGILFRMFWWALCVFFFCVWQIFWIFIKVSICDSSFSSCEFCVFVFSSLQLRFSTQDIFTMRKWDDCYWKCGLMGDAICDLNMNLTNNLSNVEFVHLKCDNNMSKNGDDQLTL
jgi:hypothetical protein